MKFVLKNISFYYLFFLLTGTLFFIPSVFVNRFITAPLLWMRIGIGLGGIGFILLRRKQIFLPPYKFLLIITTLCIYYSWRGKWHIETIATNAIYCLAILLFYNIFTTKKNRETLFAICTVIAILLCVCCIAQFVGWLPSYHNTLNITGPFDNPAGSSASLSLLLPFVLNRVNKGKERKKIIYIIISIAIIIL